MTTPVRISLDYAVDQILEWNHGKTNIEDGVINTRIKHGGAEANVMSCQIDMNTARVSGLVHPCGLIVDEVRLSMKGIESKEVFHVAPRFFSLFSVRPDRAGSASIAATTTMKMYDKGEKAVTTYFWFRNGRLHKVR